MKYLKFYKLFENFYIEDFINELKEVSEMYLAYLLDDNNIEVGVYEYQFIDDCIVIEVYSVDDKNIKLRDEIRRYFRTRNEDGNLMTSDYKYVKGKWV